MCEHWHEKVSKTVLSIHYKSNKVLCVRGEFLVEVLALRLLRLVLSINEQSQVMVKLVNQLDV